MKTSCKKYWEWWRNSECLYLKFVMHFNPFRARAHNTHFWYPLSVSSSNRGMILANIYIYIYISSLQVPSVSATGWWRGWRRFEELHSPGVSRTWNLKVSCANWELSLTWWDTRYHFSIWTILYKERCVFLTMLQLLCPFSL